MKKTIIGPLIYMYRVQSSKNMKAGAYFTLADIPSSALVQVYYAADDRNRELIHQFVKDCGYKSVKEMCESDEGAQQMIGIAKAVKKDTLITFAAMAHEVFINVNDFNGSVIRGLLPIEPEEFFKWYEEKLA